MRNFASPRVRVFVAFVAAWLSVCEVTFAQRARPQSAKERFEAAQLRDEQLRILLTNFTSDTPSPELSKQVTQVMAAFEAVVRRFPTSGYADNALWHAASLGEAAYDRLNRPEDRDRAIKLYRWLIQEYPSSSFVKRANAKVASLGKAALAPAAPTPAVTPMVTPASTAPSVPAAPATAPPPGERATLTSIQRVVMPAAVRVTIELDKEVSYREERLAGPARLFFDLRNVQLTPALMDKVISYNSDVISKIRVGRHPDNTVRVVLDLEDVSRYSVFTLYSPFRLVIDAERAAGRVASATTPAAPVEPPPPPPAAIEQPRSIIEVPVSSPAPSPPPAPVVATPPTPVGSSPATPAANAAGGFSIARQLGLSVSRIVIDPGHGGRDPGTPAKGLTEAAVTLDIALRLEKLLQKEPGVEVVLTRRTDVFIPLEERTAIANRHNADLFLSIHANSSRTSGAKGVETYFLSFASSPEAEAVAARENSASDREMHQLPDIIRAITLNNKLDESRDLAGMVQDSLVTTLRKSNRDVRSRGVKKAPFVVLIGAEMPSVLAEIAFITNKQELQLLKTSAYKDRIAQALQAAVLRYRRSLKGAVTTTVER
jgi:N-acetylmuramoyl-L-alanine amidase